MRRFNPFAFLESIGQVALTEGTDTPLGRIWAARPDATSRVLSQHALADVARFVIRAEAVHRDRLPTTNDVVQAVNIVNGLVEPIGNGGERDLADWGMYLMRLGAKQFEFQLAPGPRLARALVLYNDLPPEVPEAAEYGIPQRFLEVTGLTVEQFIWTGFVLWGQIQKGPLLDIAPIVSHRMPSLRELVSGETVARTLAIMSSSLHELRLMADAEAGAVTDPRHEHWVHNPLRVRPLVRLPGSASRYIAPVPRLVLERVVDAPYWILLDADHGRFTTAFGYVFERYVGWLLEPFIAGRLRPQFAYATGTRTSDWLVFDDDGTTLIECKTGRLHKAAKTIGAADVVAESIGTHLGQAIKQLHSVVSRVPAVDGLKELRGKDVFPLIVVLDPIYVVNSPLFEPFRAQARAAHAIPADFDPQIASVSEIELLAPQLAARSLAAVYRDKLANSDYRSWDWGTYVGNQLGEVEHPSLAARADAFFAPIEEERTRLGLPENGRSTQAR